MFEIGIVTCLLHKNFVHGWLDHLYNIPALPLMWFLFIFSGSWLLILMHLKYFNIEHLEYIGNKNVFKLKNKHRCQYNDVRVVVLSIHMSILNDRNWGHRHQTWFCINLTTFLLNSEYISPISEVLYSPIG